MCWEFVGVHEEAAASQKGTPAPALLREALRGVEGVEAAFVFGSTAAGTARPASDVDLFLVGDAVDSRELYRALNEVGILLGREINLVRYTHDQLDKRLAAGTRFVREALTGPRVWLAGKSECLGAIVRAAGLQFPAKGP